MAITKARSGVFCDYCKDQYGYTREESTGRSVLHNKAKKQAYITVVSETHYKEPVIRHYCYTHLQELSTWHDGSIWTLEEQIAYAKEYRKGQQLTIGGNHGF